MGAAVEKPGRTTSIPEVTTPLIGRDQDVAELDRLLADPGCRLVTITGPGGVGKTRVALQLAWAVAGREEESVAFVRLAAIRDPHLVLPAIGQSFGLSSDPQGDYEAFLTERFAGERALLVLDNLEQVVSAAPAIDRLLGACPGIRILATSQAALGIPGERRYHLPPLDIPPKEAVSPETIVASGAVALFVERARAANPSLPLGQASIEAIAGICRRLDGLPLAIELAAARMNILSPESLLPRLSDRLQVLGGGERQRLPARMHTVRNAVAWSYELLADPARRLMRGLSVFRDGFSLEAVEHVVASWGEGHDAYDLLGELVDRSLVRPVASPSDRPRYDMLATIRDFGMEQLREQGEEDAARRTHARFIAALAEEAGSHLTGSRQQQWFSVLDAELENIRAAAGWALDSGCEVLVLCIGGETWRYLSARNLLTEGRGWLARALETKGVGTALQRAKALLAAGFMAEDQRDLDEARDLLEQARQLAVAIGAQQEEHRSLIGLGTVAHDRGEYEIATRYHEQATAIAREIPYDRGIAIGLANLASVAYFQGDLYRATSNWEEGQEILARIGDLTGVAISACNLGAVYLELEQFERAEHHLQQALRIQRELNSLRDLTRTLINLGEAARHLGDYTLSHDAFAEAVALLQDADDEAAIGVAMHGLAQLALAQDNDAEAAHYLLESIRLLAGFDDPHSMLECAQAVAELASRQGQHEIVIELLTAEVELREAIQSPRTASMDRYLAPFLAAAHEALGHTSIQRARDCGRELTIETLPRRLTNLVREMIGRQRASPSPVPADVPADHPLTARELEILRLLAQGQSTNEVAETLFVSPRTVTTHVANILGKLEVSSRTAAVAWALRNGLA